MATEVGMGEQQWWGRLGTAMLTRGTEEDRLEEEPLRGREVEERFKKAVANPDRPEGGQG